MGESLYCAASRTLTDASKRRELDAKGRVLAVPSRDGRADLAVQPQPGDAAFAHPPRDRRPHP